MKFIFRHNPHHFAVTNSFRESVVRSNITRRSVSAIFLSLGILISGLGNADSLKEIALKFNDATSAYLLAQKHYKGHGAEKNYEQALNWYLKAARQGHIRAMLKVGEMHFYGIGTAKNYGLAARWLVKPAEKGYSNAQYLLGLIHLNGDKNNVAKNGSQALYWFKKAAEDFHAEAAYHVGRMHYYGIGTPRDLDEAKKYLLMAKEQEILQASQLLASMEANQTDEKVDIEKQQPLNPSLLDLAQNGDIEAQFELAEEYFNGTDDYSLNVGTAFRWYEKAATNGHSQSQFKMGMFFYYGEVVDKNLEKARYWFEKAAKQNVGEAAKLLALLDSQNKKRKTSAKDTLLTKAGKGDKDAQYDLGVVYLNGGQGIEPDADEALSWFIAAANQGHAEAQFQVGMIYFNPEAIENPLAEQWLTQAARNNHVEAQYFLGSLYESSGKHDEAAKWLDSAVQQGHENALDLLISIYLADKITNVDKTKAMQWLEQASKKGYIEAQYKLGELYLENPDKEGYASNAYRWISKAAFKGHSMAQYRLGLMYQMGIGVSKHYTKSASWLRKAAKSGQADAQFALGEMYRLGQGLPKKESKAKKWYQKAADQGHMEAKLRLSGSGRY